MAERRKLSLAVLAILISFGLLGRDSDELAVLAQTPVPAACNPVPPPPCKEGMSPGVIQIMPDPSLPQNKLKLARKRFYLSACPFNLTTAVNISTAPNLRSFYVSAGASTQLIAWLEENHCDSIYCRALTSDEARCEGAEAVKCVPEFQSAYRNGLSALKGNADLALRMISNYAPLSDAKLRVGFYEARAEWLKNSVGSIESAVARDYRLRTTITNKDGIGFFYDLCPGAYYISSVAPIDMDGAGIVWETLKPVRVDGPPDMNTATKVTLAFPPNKDKKNFFVGRPVSEFRGRKPGQ
jgi:hypothetical protein